MENNKNQITSNVIEYTCSYNSGVYVTTDLTLSGRGVKLSGDGSSHARGKKTYHLTASAWAKLKAKEYSNISYYTNEY